MSSYIQTLAFTLKKKIHREDDRLFTLYTKERGKVIAVAPGAAKIGSKLSSHLEPFGLLEVTIANGRQHTLIGATLLQRYDGIFSSWQKLNIGGVGLHYIDTLIKEHQPDQNIFNLLEEYMNALELQRSESKGKLLEHIFLLRLMSLLGYKPRLDTCLVCGHEIQHECFFSSSRGGILCSHEKGPDKIIAINFPTLHFFRSALVLSLLDAVGKDISESSAREFSSSMELFYQYHC